MTVNSDGLADQLLAVLRSVTGSLSLAYACAPVPLTGGFWAELFAFSLAQPPDGWPHDLVARMMPEASTARKETLIQAAVAAAGFPTPVIRAAGGPDDGLGRAFMVMDRAPGAPLLSGLSLTGALGRGPALFGEIPRLIDHPARPAPDVICHGDLHPFNLLRDGARVTLLDWSTALLAP
ncbi:MAG: phosphotransferase, partial [Streptosporangiaceae bacterium]